MLKRILIIDPNQQERRLLATQLERDHYSTTVCSTIFEAKNILLEEAFDLVIFNSEVESNERQLFRFISEQHNLNWLPVIALVEAYPPDGKVQLLEWGAVDAVIKPIHYDELRLRVEKQLRQSSNFEEVAFHDALTKVFNRRYFEHQIQLQVQRSMRQSTPISLCFIDADRFKSINDTFGHKIGDLVLIGLAKLIQDHLRPQDILSRVGGEEFVIILPNLDAINAYSLVQSILHSAHKQPVAEHDGQQRFITFSAGVCEWHESLTIDQWVHLADNAAYEAKKQGRDRVVLTSSEDLLVKTDEQNIVQVLVIDDKESKVGDYFTSYRATIEVSVVNTLDGVQAALNHSVYSLCFVNLDHNDFDAMEWLKKERSNHKLMKFIAAKNRDDTFIAVQCLAHEIDHLMKYPCSEFDIKVAMNHISY